MTCQGSGYTHCAERDLSVENFTNKGFLNLQAYFQGKGSTIGTSGGRTGGGIVWETLNPRLIPSDIRCTLTWGKGRSDHLVYKYD